MQGHELFQQYLFYDEYDLPGVFIETIIRKSSYEGLWDAEVERKRQWQSYIYGSWLQGSI